MRVINVEYYTNTLTLCEKNARRLSFLNKNIRENDVRKCERILIEHYQRELYSHFNFLRIKIFKKMCQYILYKGKYLTPRLQEDEQFYQTHTCFISNL